MNTSRALLFALAVSCIAAPAAADLTPRSPVFIVNLSDLDKGFTVVSAQTFNDATALNTAADWGPDEVVQSALRAGQDPDPNLRIQPATPLDRMLGACKAQPGGGVPPAAKPLIERLYACVSCLNAYRETRFFTDEGDQTVLFVLYDANQIDPADIRPAFQEGVRQSELVATARALAGLFRQESQAAPEPACEAFVYTLQRKRSRFTISIQVPEPRRGGGLAVATREPDSLIDPPAPAVPAASAATAGSMLTSPEVILGPSEHWFFSADFSLSATSVQLGEQPTAGEEELQNKDFFIALNFAFGDLLPDRSARLQRRSFLKELLIKIQLTPSREPWEAWAAGIGVRGYRIRTIFWNMDVVHPYFTVGRQTVDDEAKWRAVVGFGFDPRSLGGNN